MKLNKIPKPSGIKMAWVNLKEDLKAAVNEIGKGNIPKQNLSSP